MKKYFYQLLVFLILVLASVYIFLFLIKLNIGVSLKYEEWRLKELNHKIIFYNKLLFVLKNCIIVLFLCLIVSFLFKMFSEIKCFKSKKDLDFFD